MNDPGTILLALAVPAVAALIAYRWIKHSESKAEVQAVPRAKQNPSPPETENERLIRTLLVLDKNAEDRMYRLKIWIFWLPLIWGIISAVLWAIVFALR